MQIEIKDWRDQRVIWSGEADSIKQALGLALKEGADLQGADLKARISEARISKARISEARIS